MADAGQKTVQKTKEMSDILRLESLVTKEENKLEQIYSQIGKMYVSLHTDSFEDAFAGMFGEIRRQSRISRITGSRLMKSRTVGTGRKMKL